MVLLLLAKGSLSITSALNTSSALDMSAENVFVAIEKYQALKCQFIDVETDLRRFPFFCFRCTQGYKSLVCVSLMRLSDR